MCRVFKIHPSGFYAWLEKPLSDRAIEDQRLLKLIKTFYIASGATYGSPWIHRDLREAGEMCSVHRVAKIMRQNKLKAQIGYKRRHLVINALLMAVWARQPKTSVLVHSDQGSQYGSADYLAFMKANNLEPSMSRRGNCHDNAVAESFFATFKKRVTKRKIYATREDAKREIFNFIEMFYNPVKRHSHTGGVSPVQFEKDYFSKLESV